ncbi:MAG: hypothetical protein QOG64_1407, partial [Acidimicrobiaceae bacterium]|nr:hypothetical protein [Acidimicrobiaceae bacterium]
MRTIAGAPIPIYSWAPDLEPGAVQQAVHCAQLPVAFHHIAVMADGHQGYGVPIGAVMALRHAISPYAVGNDIGCGMAVVPTSMRLADLVSARDGIMGRIQATVPSGRDGHRGSTGGSANADIDPLLGSAFDAMEEAAARTGSWLSTSTTSDPGRGAALTRHDFVQRGRVQAGTLGSGNHFIELLA